MHRRKRGAVRWAWAIGLTSAALVGLLVDSQVCLRTGFSKGLWLRECPDGELRQTLQVDAPGLMRGAASRITVAAQAQYTAGPADERQSAALSAFTPTLALVGPTGEFALKPKDGLTRSGDGLTAEYEIPKVPDGQYVLRATVVSSLGTSTLELPTPLFTPARLHVLTDRPLYEPGNLVRFRAVALKASDLTPLDGRPGRWLVRDPTNEVVLEELAPAGPWGVVAGSFPLDRTAEIGTWRVSWSSGGVEESRDFLVKPFTLPRFQIEATPAKPFYQKHQRPLLEGRVRYASGAPVAKAKLELSWRVSGTWPPPTGWVDGSALPKSAVTSASGAFSVELPEVPEDLQQQAQLAATIAAVDESGDRVEGSASILLSEDAIAVTGVTELEGGLVEGLNNRVYLRATTADGQVLEGVTLNVKRLWEPTDRGTDTEVDEDGVASLQLDPGPAVNVVIPAAPLRPPPKAKAVQRTNFVDLLAEDGEVSLANRLGLDRLEPRLDACTRFVEGSDVTETVGLAVTPDGAVLGSSSSRGRLSQCVATALAGLRFEPSRQPHLYSVAWAFNDEDLPKLSVEVNGAPETPDAVALAFSSAVVDARDCLPPTVPSGALPTLALWTLDQARREVALTWVPARGGAAVPEAAVACIRARLPRLLLPNPEASDGTSEDEGASTPAMRRMVGVARFEVHAPPKYEAVRPQPTVMTGYEFLVTAKTGAKPLGATKLLMRPGSVPALRLRVPSAVVEAGASFPVDLLRGPDFTGALPEKLHFAHGPQRVEFKVDADRRTALVTVPSDVEGWAAVAGGGAQVFLYVRPKGQLRLRVTADKPRYAPGQLAQLGIETSVAGTGAPAAVGLFGVDQSLAQLAPLPGADELAGLRPKVTGAASFAGLDAQALALGRVRGTNAMAATLLRVSALPPPPELERPVALQGATSFDPNEPLVDRFYTALAALHAQAREWERTAPAAEKMSPRTLARLWDTALSALERRKESTRDAWGRRLRLHRLPGDLLALTDPRQVVVDATRLPEDTENWSAWVAKEKP